MEDEGKVKLPALGHIGVVVKDMDKAMEYYSSTYGIGPWRVVEVDYPEVVVRDKKYPWKVKVAFADLGPVELELLQVISGRSIHSEFLDEGREGLHHLGFHVAKEEKERIIARLAEEGIGVIQGATSRVHGGSYAYLDTDKTGGIIIELVHIPSEWQGVGYGSRP